MARGSTKLKGFFMRNRMVSVVSSPKSSLHSPFYPDTPSGVWWGQGDFLSQAIHFSSVMASIQNWSSTGPSDHFGRTELGKKIHSILLNSDKFQVVFTQYWTLRSGGYRPVDALLHAVDAADYSPSIDSVEWADVPASKLMTEISRVGRLLIAAFELIEHQPERSKDTQKWVNDHFWNIADIQTNHIRIASMSIGAVSTWAHRDAAIGAFLAGTIMESGEGGMDPARHGTIANTPAVQRASGVFGNDLWYFINADEVVLKLAQSAKPGEGGHLPKAKLTLTIQRLRRADQATDLVSPQPIHDLYSIEDLYLIIHSLKSLKPGLRITVKLAAETDIHITALGAVKAGASQLIISGERGGTGAAKSSSVFGTGMPLEYGLKVVHELLSELGLRDEVEIVASGGIRTGRDIVLVHALGADRCEIGTGALIALGCRMLRKCHGSREISISDLRLALEAERIDDAAQYAISIYDELSAAGYVDYKSGMILPAYKELEESSRAHDDILSTAVSGVSPKTRDVLQSLLKDASGGCTVGVNTQDLAYKTAHGSVRGYTGTAADLRNFITLLSINTIECLSDLGIPDLSAIRGNAKLYFDSESTEIEGLNRLFPSLKSSGPRQTIYGLLPIPGNQDRHLLQEFQAHFREKGPIQFVKTDIIVDERDASFGAALAGYCGSTKIRVPIRLELAPFYPAPQSIGFCIPGNMTIVVNGSGNDHIGRSASGGTLVFRRPNPSIPISLGNQVGFGATYQISADGVEGKRSQFWIDGNVGTRAFIRNSGAEAVITGNAGEHCCEFMSNGMVVILGKVGRNFASGMTGGIAIVSVLENPNLAKTHRLLPLTTVQKVKVSAMLRAALNETQSALIQEKVSMPPDHRWDEFRVFDPTDVTALLTQNPVAADVDLLLRGDKGVGSKLLGSGKPLNATFTGVAGDGFGQYIGELATFKLIGNASRLVGHLAKGTIVVDGDVGSHGFWKASGMGVVTGNIGYNSFCGFSGVAVVNSVGRRAFDGMAGTVVVMTGKIQSITPKGSGMVLAPVTIGLSTTPIPDDVAITPTLIQALNEFEGSGTVVHWNEGKIRAELGILSMSDLTIESDILPLAKSPDGALRSDQVRAGWTVDALELIQHISDDEPTTSMGDGRKVGDRQVMSYGVFRLPFAQLTRPPIDAASEAILINMTVTLRLDGTTVPFLTPVLDNVQFDRVARSPSVHHVTVPSGDVSTGDSSLDAQMVHHRLRSWANDAATIHSRSKSPADRVVIVHHYAGKESRHLPAWIPLSYLRHAFDAIHLNPQLVISTYDSIEPHSADVLLNLLGVSLIHPRLVERTFRDTPSFLEVIPSMVVSPEDRFDHYRTGMTKALKRIMAKNGDTDMTTHIGSKTVEAYLLDEKMAAKLGTRSIMGQSRFGLQFFVEMAESNRQNAGSHTPTLEQVGLYQFVLGGVKFSWDSTNVIPLLDTLQSGKTPQFNPVSEDIEDIGSDKGGLSYSKFKATYANICDSQRITLGSHLRPITKGAVVAIVGDGIAAMKSALEAAEIETVKSVIIIGKMPLPGGRLRYAVAPDHVHTKQLADSHLDQILNHPKIKLYTGIKASGDLVQELHDMGCMVVVAPGSATRKLTADDWGHHVVTGSKMVAWYNSKPSKHASGHRDCPVSLEHATLIINGH